jgi:hypothetical protein
MITVKASFATRLYTTCLALRYLSKSRTAWGWVVLTNYLFHGVIVGLEDF